MATLKSPLAEAGLAAATSANGAVRGGATLPTNGVMPQTLAAELAATIVTGSVVATVKWQGSADGSTWVDLHGPENAAFVTLGATGSTAVAAPSGAWGYEYVRAAAILSGASTASGDTTAVTYRYRAYFY